MNTGIEMKIFFNEDDKVKRQPFAEWLLLHAKKLQMNGGSLFISPEGFGHLGQIHEEHFFESKNRNGVMVIFITTKEKSEELLALVKVEKVPIFYTISNVHFAKLT